jgi:hypothetical protein
MNIAGFDICVYTDIRQYGYTEDGEPDLRAVFKISVTGDHGERWILNRAIETVVPDVDEDGYPYLRSIYDEAEAKANRLAERIQAAGVIDEALWHFDPVYCSPAYEAAGAEQWRVGL